MGVLGGFQLVYFFPAKCNLFLNAVDRIFTWSFEAV